MISLRSSSCACLQLKDMDSQPAVGFPSSAPNAGNMNLDMASPSSGSPEKTAASMGHIERARQQGWKEAQPAAAGEDTPHNQGTLMDVALQAGRVQLPPAC